MNPPNPPNFDAFATGVVVFAAAFGPTLAPLVSAYALILLGWCAGALVGLYMREEPVKRPAVYLLVTFILSVGTTGGIASWASAYLPGSIAAEAILLPLSAALAAFPDRLVAAARAASQRIVQAARGPSPPKGE